MESAKAGPWASSLLWSHLLIRNLQLANQTLPSSHLHSQHTESMRSGTRQHMASHRKSQAYQYIGSFCIWAAKPPTAPTRSSCTQGAVLILPAPSRFTTQQAATQAWIVTIWRYHYDLLAYHAIYVFRRSVDPLLIEWVNRQSVYGRIPDLMDSVDGYGCSSTRTTYLFT